MPDSKLSALTALAKASIAAGDLLYLDDVSVPQSKSIQICDLFGNGTINTWLPDGSGHWMAQTDNTYDIGASGATRPRTTYVGTSVIIGASGVPGTIAPYGTGVASQQFGLGSQALGDASTVVGWQSSATNIGGIALGNNAASSALVAIAIGYFAVAAYTDSIALGCGATTTAINQLMLGGAGHFITQVKFQDTASGAGNDTAFVGSSAGSGNTNGGSIRIIPGTKSGAGLNGNFCVMAPGGTPGTDEIQLNAVVGVCSRVQSPTSIPIYFNLGGSDIACISGNGIGLRSGYYLTWSSGSDPAIVDTILQRLAANVLGTGWMQITPGRKRNTADVTNATTTFASLSDLTITLIAGRKYTGVLRLPINESTAADGAKFDLNGGTATMTSIEYGFSAALGAVVGVRTSTALATAITLTALGDTSDVWVDIPVTLVCNAAGTIIPRQAQNAHTTGTLTIRLGGYFWLEDTP